MAKGKEYEEVLVVGNENPLIELVTKYKEFDTFFKKWLAKQSVPMEAAIVTALNAAHGAAQGVYLTPIFNILQCDTLSLQVRTRDFAILGGVSEGISCVLKRLTGKEDVETCMVAGFGAGLMVSLFSGFKGHEAIIMGASYALLYGGFFKVQEKVHLLNQNLEQTFEVENLSQKQAEDVQTCYLALVLKITKRTLKRDC